MDQTTVMHIRRHLDKFLIPLLMALPSCATKEPNNTILQGPRLYLMRKGFKLMNQPVRVYINDHFTGEIYGLQCKSFKIRNGINHIFIDGDSSAKLDVDTTTESTIQTQIEIFPFEDFSMRMKVQISRQKLSPNEIESCINE